MFGTWKSPAAALTNKSAAVHVGDKIKSTHVGHVLFGTSVTVHVADSARTAGAGTIAGAGTGVAAHLMKKSILQTNVFKRTSNG